MSKLKSAPGKAGTHAFVRACLVVATATTVLGPPPAGAQTYEAVGVRALGMGGAFVAVADDATAVWWNPAGLATGAYLNGLIEYGDPNEGGPTRGFAIAFPALGLSYYRLTVSEIQPIDPTATKAASRQDQGSAGVDLRRVELSQYATTVGQSIGDHLVVASTLKLVRGAATNRVDLDLGAMASAGIARVGLALRNVSQPTLGSGNAAVTLRREARAGFALLVRPRRAVDEAAVDLDVDVTRNQGGSGEVRRIAGGGEVWVFRRQLGLRAGVSGSTTGAARTTGSAGLSLALRRGTYVEAQLTGGADSTRSGWGMDLKVTF
jgi:hypothetical protein